MKNDMNKTAPNYVTIYRDLIKEKYPNKIKECEKILSKANLTALDVINIENIILQNRIKLQYNQKFRAYREHDILDILQYQKKHNLNNTMVARKFNLSRNTVAKWRKIFKSL